jgi:general L-amino acid transport system substrate-binding protein
MSRDLELGLEFAGISYFDGQGFLLPALYGATSPLQLGGAKICVATGRPPKRMRRHFLKATTSKSPF